MFTLLVTPGFVDVTAVVAVGISPSMAPSAALLDQLTVRSTYKPARTLTFTVTAILKATVITFTRERCEWDSGLETAIEATRMLTLTQAGLQCPGYSLKGCKDLSNNHVTREPLDFVKNFSIVRIEKKLHCCFRSVLVNRFETSVSAKKESPEPLLNRCLVSIGSLLIICFLNF